MSNNSEHILKPSIDVFSRRNYKLVHSGILANWRICALKMCFKWGHRLAMLTEMCFALPASHRIKYRGVNLCSDGDWKGTLSGLCVDVCVKQHHSALPAWQAEESSCHHVYSLEANAAGKLKSLIRYWATHMHHAAMTDTLKGNSGYEYSLFCSV